MLQDIDTGHHLRRNRAPIESWDPWVIALIGHFVFNLKVAREIAKRAAAIIEQVRDLHAVNDIGHQRCVLDRGRSVNLSLVQGALLRLVLWGNKP